MKNDTLKSNVLTMKVISNVSEDMLKELDLPEGHRCIGMVTADCDDITYIGMDEATKKANVKGFYGKSLYGGAANANSKYAGEVIGMISGPNPEEVRSGLDIIYDTVENGARFISANEDNSVIYFAHCISRTGSFMSEMAGVEEGESLSYLIAPPMESMYALDAALKAADVRVAAFFGPPSVTNFGGALLTGSQSACKAACDAFAEAVQYVVDNPLKY